MDNQTTRLHASFATEVLKSFNCFTNTGWTILCMHETTWNLIRVLWSASAGLITDLLPPPGLLIH